MKKYLYLLLLPLALIGAACDDDPEPEPTPERPQVDLLDWEVVSNSNPDKIMTRYSSPDPGCGVPKSFEIATEEDEGRVVVRCTNSNDVSMGSVAYEGKYTMGEARCLVTQLDANTFEFVLLPIEESAIQKLEIKGTCEGKRARTSFFIHRCKS